MLSLQLCPIVCDPVDCQASLSMGFSRQEYWRKDWHFLLQGIFRAQFLQSPALAEEFFTTSTTWEAPW